MRRIGRLRLGHGDSCRQRDRYGYNGNAAAYVLTTHPVHSPALTNGIAATIPSPQRRTSHNRNRTFMLGRQVLLDIVHRVLDQILVDLGTDGGAQSVRIDVADHAERAR